METTAAELVDRAARGERGAWEELVERYRRLVWSVPRAFRLKPDDADDVYQATWLALAENLTRLRDPAKVGTWLVTAAKRQSIRVVELRGREEIFVDRWEPMSHAPDPVEVVVESEWHRVLWQAFATLDERCRRLLRIAACAPDLTIGQVARAMGLRISSVGRTRGRCLTVLRRRLGRLA